MKLAATLYASVYARVDTWEMLYVAPSCTLVSTKYERILKYQSTVHLHSGRPLTNPLQCRGLDCLLDVVSNVGGTLMRSNYPHYP